MSGKPTQREVVLTRLREAGEQGVSVHDLIYRDGITRAAAIIHTLRHRDKMVITTVDAGQLPDGTQSLARYVLLHEKRPVYRWHCTSCGTVYSNFSGVIHRVCNNCGGTLEDGAG